MFEMNCHSLANTTDEMTLDEECQRLLEIWDNNELIHTVEMGGLGPGYEQAIHIICFELLRVLLKEKPSREPEKFNNDHVMPILESANETISYLKCTGAQWGAAMTVATRIYLIGYRAFAKEIPKDRATMVSKEFPLPPVVQHD